MLNDEHIQQLRSQYLTEDEVALLSLLRREF